MKLAQLALAAGVFTVAYLSVKLLSYASFENVPVMVFAAGPLAGAALAVLRSA